LASVISGGSQAFIEVIGCILAGVPNVALIGSLVFIGSFIPVVGALPITLVVALQQFFDGQQMVGGVLLVVALVVAGIDNMVRPLFLKGATNLHPLLAFVAAFGGLQTLGFLGVFLGPIVASLFVVTVQIVTHPEETVVPEDTI
jgi:predicted PurR-regulated permease PerM